MLGAILLLRELILSWWMITLRTTPKVFELWLGTLLDLSEYGVILPVRAAILTFCCDYSRKVLPLHFPFGNYQQTNIWT